VPSRSNTPLSPVSGLSTATVRSGTTLKTMLVARCTKPLAHGFLLVGARRDATVGRRFCVGINCLAHTALDDDQVPVRSDLTSETQLALAERVGDLGQILRLEGLHRIQVFQPSTTDMKHG
jgi:hypothetical protein